MYGTWTCSLKQIHFRCLNCLLWGKEGSGLTAQVTFLLLHYFPLHHAKGNLQIRKAVDFLELPNFSKGYCAQPNLPLFPIWGGPAGLGLPLIFLFPSLFLPFLLFLFCSSLWHSPPPSGLYISDVPLPLMIHNHPDHLSSLNFQSDNYNFELKSSKRCSVIEFIWCYTVTLMLHLSDILMSCQHIISLLISSVASIFQNMEAWQRSRIYWCYLTAGVTSFSPLVSATDSDSCPCMPKGETPCLPLSRPLTQIQIHVGLGRVFTPFLSEPHIQNLRQMRITPPL